MSQQQQHIDHQKPFIIEPRQALSLAVTSFIVLGLGSCWFLTKGIHTPTSLYPHPSQSSVPNVKSSRKLGPRLNGQSYPTAPFHQPITKPNPKVELRHGLKMMVVDLIGTSEKPSLTQCNNHHHLSSSSSSSNISFALKAFVIGTSISVSSFVAGIWGISYFLGVDNIASFHYKMRSLLCINPLSSPPQQLDDDQQVIDQMQSSWDMILQSENPSDLNEY